MSWARGCERKGKTEWVYRRILETAPKSRKRSVALSQNAKQREQEAKKIRSGYCMTERDEK